MDMLPDLPVEGLLDEQMAEDAAFGGRGGGDGHGLEQRRSGLSVDDSSAGAGSANGTTPMPGHLQALGGKPPPPVLYTNFAAVTLGWPGPQS